MLFSWKVPDVYLPLHRTRALQIPRLARIIVAMQSAHFVCRTSSFVGSHRRRRRAGTSREEAMPVRWRYRLDELYSACLSVALPTRFLRGQRGIPFP